MLPIREADSELDALHEPGREDPTLTVVPARILPLLRRAVKDSGSEREIESPPPKVGVTLRGVPGEPHAEICLCIYTLSIPHGAASPAIMRRGSPAVADARSLIRARCQDECHREVDGHRKRPARSTGAPCECLEWVDSVLSFRTIGGIAKPRNVERRCEALTYLIGAPGFEPGTFRSQSGRATGLRHAPKYLLHHNLQRSSTWKKCALCNVLCKNGPS